MYIHNLNENIFLNFIQIYLIILGGLSTITILSLLFEKIQRIRYINNAKKELKKVKVKEYAILYTVGDTIDNSIYNLGNCVLIIKGFEAVCDTLRRHWNPDDELKLTYTIKDEYSIDVELFFNNNGKWKKIEGLYNLSDGINYVNQYEIVVKENEKIKSILQMLFTSCITMWIGIIPMIMVLFFTGQFTGILKFDREILQEIMMPIMFLPLLFQVIMYLLAKKLQSDDKDLLLSHIIQIFIMAMPAFSILISLVYWYILLDI